MNLLYILSIGALIILVYLVYLTLSLKKLQKKNEGIYSALSFQRDRIENGIYEENDRLTLNDENYKDVNHLLISNIGNIVLSQSVANYSFFNDIGIDLSKLSIKSNTIACLMPFHRRYLKVYESMKKGAAYNDYILKRSDNIFLSGDILKYTIELILESELVIALLDGRNPNVFYEIGIAHAAGKSVLLISDSSQFQKMPFDLKSNKILLYNSLEDLKEKLSSTLKSIKHDV